MLRSGAFCKKPPYNPQKTLKKCFKFDLSVRGGHFFEPKPHRALKPTPTEPKALLGWGFQSFLRSFFSKKRPSPLPDKPEFERRGGAMLRHGFLLY